jgi:copper chaperone CopZ
MRTLALIAALALATPTALACPMADKAAYEAALQKVRSTEGAVVAVDIEGMSCGDCANKISTVLLTVEGVRAVAVDYQTGHAEIAVVPGKMNAAGIAAAIEVLGYKARANKPA